MDFISEESSILFQCKSGSIYTLDNGEVKSIEQLNLLEVGIFLRAANVDDIPFADPAANQTCGYIQINELYYPITPNVSKVYMGVLHNHMIFLFNTALHGANVVLAVDIIQEDIHSFMDVLSKLNLLNVVMLKKIQLGQSRQIYVPTSAVNPAVERFSDSILNGANSFSNMTYKGASWCQSALEKLRGRIATKPETAGSPTEVSSNEVNENCYTVNPTLRKTLHVANVASKSLATMTSGLVQTTSRLSAKALKALAAKGKSATVFKSIPATWKDSALMIGSSVAISTGIAFNGLEKAFFQVGKTAASVATDAVKARHGAAVGTATADALDAAGSTILVWHNLSNFTFRNLAVKGAKLAIAGDENRESINIGDRIEIAPEQN